ncbi:MAG TPA: SCO family protein [Rhodoferax sp.]|nr:SCO family protein [Rhodoferax sp.]
MAIAFCAALTLMGAALVSGCTQAKPEFAAVDLTGAEHAKSFELTDHNGKSRHLSDFPGKVVVLFFGYTQCPDVCPTSMAELAEVKKILGPLGDRLQGLFVTVDPERDNLEMLKAYMENFDPTFLALRPTPAALPALARDFKIYYRKIDGQTPTSYTMDHSAGSYVYDTQGRLRLFAKYGSGAKVLAKDIQTLLNGS